MNNNLEHIIYNPTDCLSEKTLFDYIDNKLSQKERHIVEKHLLDCEMCSDALEGLELVNDRKRIALIKEAINKRVGDSVKKEAVVVSFNYKMVFSVAAAIALLVVGVFFFKNMGLKESKMGDMAVLKTEETEQNSPPPPPLEETSKSDNQPTSGSGSTTIVTKSESNTYGPLREADQEIAVAESQTVETGYYKNPDLDSEGQIQNNPASAAGNSEVVLADEISASDDRNDATLKSIPKTIALEKEKDSKPDASKKSGTTTPSVVGGTYAKSSPAPEKVDSKKSGDTPIEQTELAKQQNSNGKFRSKNERKTKGTASSRDNSTISKEETIAYQPASVNEDKALDRLEEEKKVTETSATDVMFGSTIVSDSTEEVYSIAEQMPEYPGGNAEMMKFISKNFNYSLANLEQNTLSATKIYVQFTVNRDGVIKDVKVLKGINDELNKEAIRVVKAMPKWKPGKQNGKTVSVKYTIPIQVDLK
jgi:TonB family protein